MTKRSLLMIALVLAGAVVCFAQNKDASRISGTWRLVKAGGEKIETGSKSVYSNLTLRIAAGDSLITIEKTKIKGAAPAVTESFTFYDDERGETNAKAPLDYRPDVRSPVLAPVVYPEKVGSKTRWEEGKLVTRYEKTTVVRSKGTAFVTGTDEWKLSEDGKKLILTRSFVSENNAPDSDELFGNNLQTGRMQFVFERVP